MRDDCFKEGVMVGTYGTLFALILIAGIIGFLSRNTPSIQDQAVESGVAEWYLDSDHIKRFRFIPPQAEKGNP